MRAFVQRHLDPGELLGEVLFALIMALGFTGAVRIGLEEPDNRALFLGILGCNVAWALVDGVMYILGALFERGRKARLFREVADATSDEVALAHIAAEIDGPLIELMTAAERERLQRQILQVLRERTPEVPRLRADDLRGGAAAALVIVATTFPIVAPYLLLSDPGLAVRVSNTVALCLLFLVGLWWARLADSQPLRVAFGLMLVGIVLVGVTIALGG